MEKSLIDSLCDMRRADENILAEVRNINQECRIENVFANLFNWPSKQKYDKEIDEATWRKWLYE